MDKMRRLSDKILAAHEQACSEAKADVAKLLLEALEMDLSSMGGGGSTENRAYMEEIEKAFERQEKIES
mgnify:CR=1 FL=1